ncbi:MAG: dockerin type I domain-containing protein [Planctomycetota bacterium]
MQRRRPHSQKSSVKRRLLSAENLEARQLLAFDLTMLGGLEGAMPRIADLRLSGDADISALVSRFQGSGLSPQGLSFGALREQVSSLLVNRLQGSVETTPEQSEAETISDTAVADEGASAVSSPNVDSESTENSEIALMADEELSVDVAIPAVEASDETRPRDSIVRNEDGTIDREATRESLRAQAADSNIAEQFREQLTERFDGDVPENLQEIASRLRDGDRPARSGELRERLEARIADSDLDPSELIVRNDDGTIDREATRESLRAQATDSDIAEQLREDLTERFDGEVTERIQVRFGTDGEDRVIGAVGRQDVNRDGVVTPLDALSVINVLNGMPTSDPMSYDVNGDETVTSLDALMVINQLNSTSETETPSRRSAVVDQLFASDSDDDDRRRFGFGARTRLFG